MSSYGRISFRIPTIDSVKVEIAGHTLSHARQASTRRVNEAAIYRCSEGFVSPDSLLPSVQSEGRLEEHLPWWNERVSDDDE